MNIRWLFEWTVAVLAMRQPFTFSSLVSKPMNTVSVVGNRTRIECSRNPHEYPVDWEFALAGSNDFSIIYTSRIITKSLSSRYKIDTDNITRYDIIIDSVDLSHAGIYRCTPIVTEEHIHASAQLTVLASNPVCNLNASVLNNRIQEHEYIRMWCTVNYTGNLIPVMEWTRNNVRTTNAIIAYNSNSSEVTSSLTIQLNSSDKGATFECKTSFKLTSIKTDITLKTGEMPATNVPHYEHLWNYIADVSYAPRDLTILPTNSRFKVGDRLQCLADGNPIPSYEWIEIETNRTISGSVLTIDEHMNSHNNHSFVCTAFNNVTGFKKRTSKTVTFTVAEQSGFTTEQYIIILIIVIGAVCCIVLALYLGNNRCPFKRGISRPEPDILQAVQISPYGIIELAADRSERQPFQPTSPVYSSVNKETRDDESRSAAKGSTGHLPRHQDLPLYTEVVKNKNGSKNSDGPRQTVEATATQHRLPPKTFTTADGTQYMDVTSIRDQASRGPIRNPPMFSAVDTYASIDHTVNAPPPPLPPKRK